MNFKKYILIIFFIASLPVFSKTVLAGDYRIHKDIRYEVPEYKNGRLTGVRYYYPKVYTDKNGYTPDELRPVLTHVKYKKSGTVVSTYSYPDR